MSLTILSDLVFGNYMKLLAKINLHIALNILLSLCVFAQTDYRSIHAGMKFIF